jgi:hypothetical protein
MTVNGVTSNGGESSVASAAASGGKAEGLWNKSIVLAQAQSGNDTHAGAAPRHAAIGTGAHSTTTIDRGDGHSEVRQGGTRAWRDNNPGNLEYGTFAREHGAIGFDTGTGHHEAVFPDHATGDAAQRALLHDRYGNQTVQHTMYVYAPPSENDTEQYLSYLERHGVDRNAHINDLSATQFNNLVEQIQSFEGWRQGTVRAPSGS